MKNINKCFFILTIIFGLNLSVQAMEFNSSLDTADIKKQLETKSNKIKALFETYKINSTSKNRIKLLKSLSNYPEVTLGISINDCKPATQIINQIIIQIKNDINNSSYPEKPAYEDLNTVVNALHNKGYLLDIVSSKVFFENVFIAYITSSDYITNLESSIGDLLYPIFRKKNPTLTKNTPSGPYINPTKSYILSCRQRDCIDEKEIISFLDEQEKISCAIFFIADIDEEALEKFINFLYKKNPPCLQNKLVLLLYTTNRGYGSDYYSRKEQIKIKHSKFSSLEEMVKDHPNICLIYASQPGKMCYRKKDDWPSNYLIKVLKKIYNEQIEWDGKITLSDLLYKLYSQLYMIVRESSDGKYLNQKADIKFPYNRFDCCLNFN